MKKNKNFDKINISPGTAIVQTKNYNTVSNDFLKNTNGIYVNSTQDSNFVEFTIKKIQRPVKVKSIRSTTASSRKTHKDNKKIQQQTYDWLEVDDIVLCTSTGIKLSEFDNKDYLYYLIKLDDIICKIVKKKNPITYAP